MRLPKEDSARIEKAIEKAEASCSGEIKVHIQKTLSEDIMKAAVAKFNALGMANTAARNGVLIFIASEARQLTIIGDEGIHSQVAEGFWQEAVDAMTSRFKTGDFIGGIEDGVQKVGVQLAKLYPRKETDKDELSNEVSLG